MYSVYMYCRNIIYKYAWKMFYMENSDIYRWRWSTHRVDHAGCSHILQSLYCLLSQFISAAHRCLTHNVRLVGGLLGNCRCYMEGEEMSSLSFSNYRANIIFIFHISYFTFLTCVYAWHHPLHRLVAWNTMFLNNSTLKLTNISITNPNKWA